MRPNPRQAKIFPKISTMPRQQTEAAAYLDIYKLVNEKKRLQKELASLEERRELIQNRLVLLDTQIATLETTAHQLRDGESPQPTPAKHPPKPSSETFNMEFLEY
jgi:chromosome segregation ATPase